MKKGTIITVAVALILVAGGLGLIVANGNKDTETTMDMPSTSSSSMSSTSSTSNSTTNAMQTDKVMIMGYAFSPATIKVKVGTKVTWTNNDSVKHTVTADKGDGPKSELFGKGETYSYTFDKAGTYSYFCEPHPYMKGTVIVE